MRCRTLDTSPGGLSLPIGEQLGMARQCAVGFRIGIPFINMDAANGKAVARLMMG